VDFQEFMIAPVGAASFAEALRMGSEVYHALGRILHDEGLPTTIGDEGGFAPPLARNDDAVAIAIRAIEAAGYRPGEDIAMALDPATSEVEADGRYVLAQEGRTLASDELVDLWEGWLDRYPIVSIEDGMAQEDWDGWRLLTERLGSRVQLVGDDLFVTNVERIRRGVAEGSANSVLIKVNQIGTLTETLAAMAEARRAGWSCVMSHRSPAPPPAASGRPSTTASSASKRSLARRRGMRDEALLREIEATSSRAAYPNRCECIGELSESQGGPTCPSRSEAQESSAAASWAQASPRPWRSAASRSPSATSPTTSSRSPAPPSSTADLA
jgi:enolase